ncbi:MAG: NAD(P)-dependent oxidoreductase [Alphaproteobacteria bacterium]|nr:NAD(P)-dependent oxidoreductase [Alphaproteobacteria bacterium]
MNLAPVAVIGASGLIGAAVAARLRRERPVLRVGRHRDDHVHLDLARPIDALSAALDGVEDVVHCGGVTDEEFAANPAAAWQRATTATTKLAALLKRAGVRRVVYVSSAHVYGPLAGPLTERTPADPRSDYALAHFSAEQIFRRSGFLGAALRPCAVFGMPPDLRRFKRWGLIPFGFPRMACETGVIKLATAGLQRRNFVSARTVADQAALALASAGSFRVINPVGGDDLTVRQYAQLVCELATEALGRPCCVEAPAGVSAEAPLAYLSDVCVPSPPGALARLTAELIRRLQDENLHEDSQRRRASA